VTAPVRFRSSTSLRSVCGAGRVRPPWEGVCFRPIPVLALLAPPPPAPARDRSAALPLFRTATTPRPPLGRVALLVVASRQEGGTHPPVGGWVSERGALGNPGLGDRLL
jgi:hypothetical protein